MVAALTAKQWNALLGALEVAAQIAALEVSSGLSFATSDANRFDQREQIFAILQGAAGQLDYAELAERLTAAGATFERYRTMYEMARDPQLVTDNPLFGPSPENPSQFAYPATRSFVNVPELTVGDPRPAPYLGQHSEQVLSDVLGLDAEQISTMIDSGLVAGSDKDKR
jgi:2-methylfumaryl-CoA isomerase